jgi:hypothetical protein
VRRGENPTAACRCSKPAIVGREKLGEICGLSIGAERRTARTTSAAGISPRPRSGGMPTAPSPAPTPVVGHLLVQQAVHEVDRIGLAHRPCHADCSAFRGSAVVGAGIVPGHRRRAPGSGPGSRRTVALATRLSRLPGPSRLQQVGVSSGFTPAPFAVDRWSA